MATAFLDGAFSKREQEQLEMHLDECADCLALLAALARTSSSRHTSAASLAPSASAMTLGRYVLLHLVGVGAMGAVYAAYDPELDRKIALKLVRMETRSDDATRRLLKEARALARLSHRNVVSIFDVGRFDAGLFLAMEYVDGVTLRAWLRSQPRSWREIVGVFVDAGRGLAAAHARGL